MTESSPPSGRAWLHRNVVALGVVSLLTDTASEMIVPLLPYFVGTLLGGGAQALGWIEGAANLLQNVLKLVTGRLADRVGRNKPFVLLGYSLSSLARPLVGVALSPLQVLFVRLADRTGKGIRTSPRDAIVMNSVPMSARGRAFGFHRALDHGGAVLGPLIAYLMLREGGVELRTLFLWAIVPGLLTVVILFAFVRETERPPAFAPIHFTDGLWPDAPLRRFLVPLFVYGLGTASDLFLLLLVGSQTDSLAGLPLVWMALHVVKSGSSLLGGRIADAIGARLTLGIGWALHTAFFVAFACVDDKTVLVALIVAYGIQTGMTEGPEKSWVAALAPLDRRAQAFGWYYFTTGLAALPASVVFGAVFDGCGKTAAFLTAAALSAVGMMLLVALRPGRAKSAAEPPPAT
ncbi:MAG: MFS transporter [Planctomycetes bacterium]|nr:MFS transporter [Planctomycetota bacterium]